MNSIPRRGHLIMLFILLLAPAARAQQTQTDDSISGHVTNESGQPVAGAYVSVVMMGTNRSQQSTTDSEGYFKIQGLDAGIYRMFLSASGYAVMLPTNDGPVYRRGDKAELTLIRGGVIAGTVTNINGEPVVNLSVRALRIRDADGNKITTISYYTQPKFTDDRGNYRIYGLTPGSYLIAAGGQGRYFGSLNPFARDALTFAPSSTRDTAVEVLVRSNQEATADVRYRGEPGHAVSGKVSGALPATSFSVGVRLTDVQTRMVDLSAGANSVDKTFQLDGVSDGEYEITAAGGDFNGDLLSSAPRRITVRGADLTGVDLPLTPMSSIEAHVTFETDAKLNCGRRRDSALRETLLSLQRAAEEKATSSKDKPASPAPITQLPGSEGVPNDKGDVSFRNLFAGTYRPEVRLPGAGWYLRALTLTRSEINIARNGLALKQGEKVAGLTIAIAEGGASLRGRIALPDGQSLPPNLRIYLVPAEREQSDNPLRFFEAAVAGDGTFAIGHIAPGKYLLVTEPAERLEGNTIKSPRTDNDLRARIVRHAAALDQQISFKPCERTVDYEFRYPAAKP